MAYSVTTSVYLVGGPFDGHWQPVALALSEMARVIALPVNRNVVRMLGGRNSIRPQPIRVAALYRRDELERHRYSFLCFCRPEDIEMECGEY